MKDENDTALVSVIIPCYNHGRYLPEAVASVVAQTYDAWEIIIVDDGSTDDSAMIVEQLIACYPRQPIRLLRQANQGLSTSRNNGIQAAHGTYILPLDADDMIEPHMLAETVAVLEQRPDVGFVYTDVRMFGAETRIWSGGAYSLNKLCFDCPMTPMTLFRKDAWVAAGQFSQNLCPQGYEDWDFWLSLAEAGWEGYHIASALVCYRRTNGSMLARARLHDIELRAQIVLNHPRLYHPALVAWAVQTRARIHDGVLYSHLDWLYAFAGYALVIAWHNPRLLPKTLVRPLFCRLSARQQGYVRKFAWLVGSRTH